MSDLKEVRDIQYVTEYEKNGETKSIWTKCGALFIFDTYIGIKLDAMPMSGQKMMAFPRKEKEDNWTGKKEDPLDFLK
jgi:hypothetical protein